MNDRIEKIAKTLGITYAEAQEMIEEDAKIDRMSVKSANDDLNADQKRAIKKYTNVARGKEVNGVDAYGKKKKRTIKEDEIKRMLISTIANAIENLENVDTVDITNIQKTIAFKIGEDDFEIDLKRKRKPKK